MAVFDTAHRDLYVACTGDSRAVAGVWEKTADGQGQWRVEVLSEDQTGRNPNELKRQIFYHCSRLSPVHSKYSGYNRNIPKMKQTTLFAKAVSSVDWSLLVPLAMLDTNGRGLSKKRTST